MGQPEGERVVAVGGAGAVLVVDALALALGVVVDVGDADRRRRVDVPGRAAPAGSAARSSHTSTRSSRLASLNTGWMTLRLAPRQAAVRRDGLDRAVERVVAGAALEALGVELRVGPRPVRDRRVVADEAARAAQQVALEVVGLDRVAVGVEPRVGGDAGGVEVPVDAGAQVERCARSSASRWRWLAVLDPVDQRRRGSACAGRTSRASCRARVCSTGRRSAS